jgi:hypothetical protein
MTMTLEMIDKRIDEVQFSYQKQLATRQKYDHTLTEFLKKELDWLREQRRLIDGKESSFYEQ